MSDFIWVEKYRPKTIDECILPEGIKKTFKDIKKNSNQSTILFAPACASYDQYKNFEERGIHFNKLIKNYIN